MKEMGLACRMLICFVWFVNLIRPMLKIGDEENAIMVARYLIEDNEAEKITFDMNITNSISVVKSAMRHLLDNYVVLNPA